MVGRPTEFPVGVKVVTGETAKRLWAAVDADPDCAKLAPEVIQQLATVKAVYGSIQLQGRIAASQAREGVAQAGGAPSAGGGKATTLQEVFATRVGDSGSPNSDQVPVTSWKRPRLEEGLQSVNSISSRSTLLNLLDLSARGKLPRAISAPTSQLQAAAAAAQVSGFTDVIDLCLKLQCPPLNGTVVNLNSTLVHPRVATARKGVPFRANVKMWPKRQSATSLTIEQGLFTLEKRWLNAFRFQGTGTGIKGGGLVLSGACILLDGTCKDFVFENVTLKGAGLICYGKGCEVTFENANFENCFLAVLDGAQATLKNTHIDNSITQGEGIGVYATGQDSKVSVQGGSISGGAQGIAVHDGARLVAKGLEVQHCTVTGIEAKDASSFVDLEDCFIKDLAPGEPAEKRSEVRGVLIQSRSSTKITQSTITNSGWGLCARRKAAAMVSGTTIHDCAFSGCDVSGESAVSLTECSVTRAGESGVSAWDSGTHVELEKTEISDCKIGVNAQWQAHVSGQACSVKECKEYGLVARNKALLSVDHFTTEGNKAGFWAELRANVTMVDCSSTSEREHGCGASDGGFFDATRVAVRSCGQESFKFGGGAQAKLDGCVSEGAGQDAVCASDESTDVKVTGGMLKGSGACGVRVVQGAHAVVEGVSSEGHGEGGFKCVGEGSKLSLFDCESEGCEHYVSEEGGVIDKNKCKPPE